MRLNTSSACRPTFKIKVIIIIYIDVIDDDYKHDELIKADLLQYNCDWFAYLGSETEEVRGKKDTWGEGRRREESHWYWGGKVPSRKEEGSNWEGKNATVLPNWPGQRLPCKL